MTAERRRTILTVIALAVGCYFLYCFGNSALSLTDPDDVFYADTAKEMLTQGSFLTPLIFDQPQFEKPPLYYWLLMAIFSLIGITAWSARLVGALFGCLSVLLTYFFARRIANEKTGVLTAAILATTIWWVGLSRVVLTDLVFSTFIMVGLYAFYRWFVSRRSLWLNAFAASAALATLAKGPLGLALPLAVAIAFLAVMQEWKGIRQLLLHYWWAIFLVLTLPWYLYAAATYGDAFIREFFVHDHWHRFLTAEHADFDKWYFYPGMMLVSFLPWTAYLPFVIGPIRRSNPLVIFALVWLLVMGGLLSVPHSKLATYISPVYPALALLLALGLGQQPPVIWRKIVTGALLLAAGGALVVAIVLIPKYVSELASGAMVSCGLLAASAVVAAGLALSGRISRAVVVSGAGVLVFVVLSTQLVARHLEAGLTQAELPAIVSRTGYQGRPILCSSLYARGIFFYTGNPVVVISENPNPFWSEHPVPILSTKAQITQYLSGRDSLMCVVSPRDMRRLSELASPMGEIDTLVRAMNKTVVMYRSHAVIRWIQ